MSAAPGAALAKEIGLVLIRNAATAALKPKGEEWKGLRLTENASPPQGSKTGDVAEEEGVPGFDREGSTGSAQLAGGIIR
jgi:hypothetical protein